MKASTELYSELFKEYILSSRDIRELQVVLYGMLEKVCFLLDKYNIDYMLSGGTLLGAIRHGGFIPWDDDVDIMMTRDCHHLDIIVKILKFLKKILNMLRYQMRI